jgi:lysozyme family protein
MADFEKAYNHTMNEEGGYSHDPNDAGGETYKGVSRRFHSGWEGWKIIDALKRSPNFPKCLDRDQNLQLLVKSFYKHSFWDRFQGDIIPIQELAEEMFDTGVNMDVTRSVKFLQTGLNYLNRNGKLFPDMVDDGLLGPTTLNNLKTYLQKDSPDILIKIMNVLQGQHYLNYMSKSPTQETYCRGWFRRVDISKTSIA